MGLNSGLSGLVVVTLGYGTAHFQPMGTPGVPRAVITTFHLYSFRDLLTGQGKHFKLLIQLQQWPLPVKDSSNLSQINSCCLHLFFFYLYNVLAGKILVHHRKRGFGKVVSPPLTTWFTKTSSDGQEHRLLLEISSHAKMTRCL